MEYGLVDTGFWYGIFDNTDGKYNEARDYLELLDYFNLILPWPTLYETLRTGFVKNSLALNQFESFFKIRNVVYLDDTEYRDEAFNLSIESSLRKNRPLSMVDCLLRLIIDDPNVKTNYFLTFNTGDFVDVCNKNRVEIIPSAKTSVSMSSIKTKTKKSRSKGKKQRPV